MKNLKKLLALLMAMAMVVALGACSSSDDGGSDASDAGSESSDAGSTDAESNDTDSNDTDSNDTDSNDTESNDTGSESGDSNSVTVEGGTDMTGIDLSGYTIGYVTINSSAPWGGLVGTSMEEYAKSCGATVKSLDANTNPDDVTNYCNQMIDAGVDALAVFGGDPTAMVDVAATAAAAGVPLFLCALDVDEAGRDNTVACIGPDQEEMCYQIGQYVIEQNGADAGCTVVQISGVPYLMDYQLREAGFARAMEETNYTLLEADYAYSSRTDAKSLMEQHIQSQGSDIDIVMGFDDDLTMGAVAAIDEAGMTDQIKVYSLTGQNDAIQAVADGQMDLTVMNRATDIGAETVRAIYEYLSTGSTPYYHYTPLTYINADNVSDYIGTGEF